MDGVYPLWFLIASEEFFIKENVFFGVDTCSRSGRGPFNGAVDAFIIEAFIYEAAIAGDSRFSGPAVNVSLVLVCGVGEKVHGGLGDAVFGSTYGTVV